MHRFFQIVHSYIALNKRLAILGAFAVFVVLGFFASRLKFEEDITKLIPMGADKDVVSRVMKQMNFADKITVIIRSKDNKPEPRLFQMAQDWEDLAQKNLGTHLSDIQGKMPEEELQQTLDFVYEHLPIFLDESDYNAIDSRLNPDSLAQTVQANYRSFLSPSSMVTVPLIRRDPLGLTFKGMQKLQQMQLGSDFIMEQGYITTPDRSVIFLFLTPKQSSSETQRNKELAEKLAEIRENISSKYASVGEVHYFGAALIAVANADVIKTDVLFTTLLAMSALMVILMVFYRKFWIPFVIFLPTLFGAVFALSVLYFIKETISAISIGIGAILIGITIDYSLHILTHAKHNSDIKQLYKDVTQPLFMSSATTALAFLCLIFVQSEALRDLGIFAAAIVMGSAFFSLIIVPQLYKPSGSAKEHHSFIDRWAGFEFDKNPILLLVCLGLIVVSIFTAPQVSFDNNLAKLNYVPEDQQLAESILEQNSSLTSKTIYVASYGEHQDEALDANQKLSGFLKSLKDKGEIIGFSSIGNIVLSEQQQKLRIQQWNEFWKSRQEKLQEILVESGSQLGMKPNTYAPFFEVLTQDFGTIDSESYAQLTVLPLRDYINEKPDFTTVSTLVKVKNDQRAQFLKVIQDQENTIAIDRQEMNESFLIQLRDDFNALINYSFLAVVLILFYFFRKAGLVLLALIPIVLTGWVTAGLMGVFGLELNIFSTIVCTLVFGHGVDFSIFMTSALQKEYTDGVNQMRVYRTSIILAAITTILGVGALIFARHPSLYSISSVSLLGVFAAIAMTFVLYPALFRWVLFKRQNNGKAPLRVRRTLHSFASFTYYGLAGLAVSMATVFVLKVLPGNRDKKLLYFHKWMARYMRSVFWTYPAAKRTLLNPTQEDFKTPAVIIANHASFLDVLEMGCIHNKVIYLVADHVYNSPIIGKGIQLAGFHPVSQGLDTGLDSLKAKVDQGYSIVVFPEGTRSEDNYIRRFHKGAFHLAESFKLDIVPVLLHGYSEVAPKGDVILYPSPLTAKILARIPYGSDQYPTDLSAKTKAINALMRKKHLALRYELEGSDYFKRTLIESYDYKEPVVIQEVKKDLDMNLDSYFELFHNLDPKARIARIGNDYGALDILLALQHPMRKISTFITDTDNRNVARTNYYVRKRKIEYKDQDFEDFSTIDVLILGEHVALPEIQLPKTLVILNEENRVQQLIALGYKLIQTHGKLKILKYEGVV